MANFDNNDIGKFRFNDASHEGHMCQNGILIWFSTETAILKTSPVCMKV